MYTSEQRKLLGLLGVVVLLEVIGTIGFARWENVSLGDAFYQTTLVLLRHFGHFEIHNTSARILNIALILASLGVLGYLLKWFAEYMMGISENVRRHRVKRKIEHLKDHYIICGLGRVGSQVAQEMHNEGVAFVAVDRDENKVNEALAKGYLATVGDSTAEGVLDACGIARAEGLVASLGEDSQNLFVTLAARSQNPNLYIVARANRAENEIKLKRAGADRVALPYQIGGYHMASMALRPNVVDYLDIMAGGIGGSDLEVEEMLVGENSRVAGRRLGKALVEGEVGATVIAINGVDGVSRVRPTGREVVYPGDRLIIMGTKHDLTNASALIR